MKTRYLSIITIVSIMIFTSTNIVFAQVAPVAAFQTGSFKGNHGTYQIPYNIINGTVVSTLLDLPAKELLFEINTTSDGQLTVELPRAIIDSKNGSEDTPYFVGVYNIRSLGGPMKITPEEINNSDMRILKINFTKDITEIEIAGTFFVEKYHYAAPNSMSSLSPLKQYESGLATKDITCKSDFQLMIKTEDGSPACVKPQTVQKLVEHEWGIVSLSNNMHADGSNFSVNYAITNAKVLGIKADVQSKSLIVSIKTTGDGQLTIDIPRALIDAKMNVQTDDQFVVLNNGQEVVYTETKTSADRTLTVLFTADIEEMEFIASFVT